MERRIWGFLVFPKLRSTNACSFLACPYGFDCQKLILRNKFSGHWAQNWVQISIFNSWGPRGSHTTL